MDSIGRPDSLTVLVVIAVIIMVVVAAVFVLRLLMKFRVVHSDMMPLGGKVAFWAALAYTLLPIDVLPDPLLLDDIGALALALVYINSLIRDGDDDGFESPPEVLGGG